MTSEQMAALAAAIRANTDATIVSALAARRDDTITDWYNQASTTLAWRNNVGKQELFEAMNLATFDTVSAGKRDAWKIVLDAAPIDGTKSKLRKGIVDIFAEADAATMLTACTEYATKFELIFGGNSTTSGGVTAIKRNVYGPVSLQEVSVALNTY